MAKIDLATLNPVAPVPPAVFKGSAIEAKSSFTLDSRDIPVTTEPSAQSKNSIFVSSMDQYWHPGINIGSDMDVYMIKYEDQGITWADPLG